MFITLTIFIFGIYVGQEYYNIPSIRNLCIILYDKYQESNKTKETSIEEIPIEETVETLSEISNDIESDNSTFANFLKVIKENLNK